MNIYLAKNLSCDNTISTQYTMNKTKNIYIHKQSNVSYLC